MTVLRCGNCRQNVPEARIQMHEAFCNRNNFYCQQCDRVLTMKLRKEHWHCDRCDWAGSTAQSEALHQSVFHTPIACRCGKATLELKPLHSHQLQDCPERIIECRFCHCYEVAGPVPADYRDRLAGLSQHEVSTVAAAEWRGIETGSP